MRSHAGRRWLAKASRVALLLSAAALSCIDLKPIASGVCGNFVVDDASNEDCDRFADEPGAACGAPDSEDACRFICSGTAVCPKGYGCGADAVCRRPSGELEELGAAVEFPSLQGLATGDFNADGATDLLILEEVDSLGRRVARIVYPAAQDAEAKVVAVPVLPTTVCVAELDDDAGDDVGFGDVGGVAVFDNAARGLPEIEAFPSLLPAEGSFLRGVPLDVIADEPGDEVVVLVESDKGGTALIRPAGLKSKATLVELAGDAQKLAGEVSAGRIDEAAACPQIVVAFRGATEVFVFSPCEKSGPNVGWNEGGSATAVALPPGQAVESGAELADLDLDGHLDLLIGASDGLFVAWGAGDGSLVSDKMSGAANSAGPFPLPAETGGLLPLAIADINGDGVVDFVVPSGVVLSGPAGYQVAHENLGAPWSVAVVADLNANGLRDVAAASQQSLDIEFLNNAGSGILNPAIVLTGGPVKRLVAGDFDGDLINDLAFSQEADDEGETSDTVAVAFGRPYSPPLPPIQMARLAEVEQLYAGHGSTLGGSAGALVADGIADLFVVSENWSQTDALIELHGNASQLMVAPLALRTRTGLARPLALAAGRFGDDVLAPGEPPDVVMVALAVDLSSLALELFRIEPADEIEVGELAPSATLPEGFHSAEEGPPFALHYGAFLTAGDLSGDGSDEVVMVAPWGDKANGAALVIGDYDFATATFALRDPQPFELALSVDSELQLHDVDGDGELDALVLGGTDEEPGDVLVLWGKEGGLDVKGASRIQVKGGATGVTCLPSKEREGCALLLLGRDAAFFAMLGEAGKFEIVPAPALKGGTAVISGDFDSDGVSDVAIGDDDGLQLFRSIPEHP